MAVVHDNHTKTLNLPLPDKDNFLQDDVQRLIETINTLDEKVATKDASGRLDPAQLPTNAATLEGGYLDPAQIPPLVAQRNAQTGKIPSAILPREGLTNVMDASNQAAMLNLNATIGDIARRIDTNSYFMLVGSPSNDRASWRELPQTAVYSVNGKVGAITGIAASGVNHDITDLTGLTGQLHLPVDGADDMAAVTKRQLDKAGGGYVSQVVWHHNRTSIPDGYLLGDGEEIDQTIAPTLFEAVQAGRVPVCTEAEWWASPSKRGCYTLGATAGKFRVPDYNGVQSGSFAAPFLRGSLPGDFIYKGWIQMNAAPNITGTLNNRPWYVVAPDAPAAPTSSTAYNLHLDSNGAFKTSGAPTAFPSSLVQGPVGVVQKLSKNVIESINFDASASNAAYGRIDPINGRNAAEVRPNAVVGCYIIRFAGRALDPGTVDPVATATQLNLLYSDIKKLNNTIGYELLDFGTMAVNQRKVLPNPFGNNTPVICHAEVYHSVLKKWISGAWTFNPVPNPPQSHGLYCAYSENEGIVLRTGSSALISFTGASGATGDMSASYSDPSPVRVHIWNVGKDTTQLELQRVAVSKLSDLWLPANDPRVTEYIEWPRDVVFGDASNQVSPGELLVNIKNNAIMVKGIIRRQFKASLPTVSTSAAPLTLAQIDANYVSNAANRRILRVKKMLPGFSQIPRCYGNGTVDFVTTGIKSQDATSKMISTVPSGRAMIYCGMNDGAHTKYPGSYLNALTLSDFAVQDATWYIFDIIIPFA